MIKKINEFDAGFTNRKKGFFSLGAVGFALLWVILWFSFPMEWYSLFCASIGGSIVTLVLLAAVLAIPMCWIASLVTTWNVSVTKNIFVNVICLVGIAYLFAIFRFSAVYWLILGSVLHAALMVWVIGTADSEKVRLVEKAPLPIKKQPLVCIAWAVLYTLIIEAAYLFLFYKIAYIFKG